MINKNHISLERISSSVPEEPEESLMQFAR